jgi:hypothetical protein
MPRFLEGKVGAKNSVHPGWMNNRVSCLFCDREDNRKVSRSQAIRTEAGSVLMSGSKDPIIFSAR